MKKIQTRRPMTPAIVKKSQTHIYVKYKISLRCSKTENMQNLKNKARSNILSRYSNNFKISVK